jgi:hypothetical protein
MLPLSRFIGPMRIWLEPANHWPAQLHPQASALVIFSKIGEMANRKKLKEVRD